jgi:SAM-dependent methyltransferase
VRLEEIDFAAMYREALQRSRLVPKPAEAWDTRAASYAGQHGGAGQPGKAGKSSTYVADFIARMNLGGARSLLDVGCGPGTLALPLAARLAEVVALDYSPRMLEQLQAQALAEGVGNVRTVRRAWDDDWSDLPVCDIAIASRSTTVDDLEAALRKLQQHARLRVYLTYPVGGVFVDRELIALSGQAVPEVPDHFLLLGMLHRMGVVPRVDILQTPSRLANCSGFDEFAERLAWSTGPLDAAAQRRLRDWYEADPERAARGGSPMRWAFIGWDVA